MDCGIEKYMTMGLVMAQAFPEVMAPNGPWVESTIEIARDPFFSGIEVTSIADEGVRTEVKAICRDAGLAIAFGAQPVVLGNGLNINSLDEAARQKAVDRLKQTLDEACFYGAEAFSLLSGKDPGPADRQAALAALYKSLGQLCAHSTAINGPPVILEAFDTAVDKCCLIGPASLCLEVARTMAKEHNNFGLMVDLSHIPLLEESPRQALEPVKDHVLFAHLGNAVMDKNLPGYGDNHPIFGAPGGVNGVPELAEFLKVLLEIGFLNEAKRPWVSFEIKPLPGQDSSLIIANAKRTMNRAWSLI